MKNFILSALLMVTVTTQAEDYSKVYAANADAIIKISILLQGVPVSFGSGFFINKDGYFLTNYHVIQSLFTPGYIAEVKTKSGKKSQALSFVNCDIYGLDLCLLKIDLKPEKWIEITAISQAKVGSSVALIGHPKGLEWTISDGLISSVRDAKTKNGLGFKEVQISVPVSPGASGSPIFDISGKLVGVVTSGIFNEQAQNLNFGVYGTSVAEFYNFAQTKKVQLIQDVAKGYNDQSKKLAKLIFDKKISPYLEKIEKGLTPKGDIGYFKFQSAQGREVSFLYPKLEGLIECFAQTEKKRALCYVGRSELIIVNDLKPAADFKIVHGYVPPPEPMIVTQSLFKNGLLNPALNTPKTKKFLFSVPNPVKCVDLKSKVLGPYARCSGLVYNFDHPNHTLLRKELEFQKGKPVLEVMALSTDSMTSLVPFALADFIEISFANLTEAQKQTFK